MNLFLKSVHKNELIKNIYLINGKIIQRGDFID